MTVARKLVAGVLIGAVVAVAGAAALALGSSEFGWRARVLKAKLAGQLPEIPAAELIRWLRPGSAMYLEKLAEAPNPHAAIRNLRTGTDAAANGERLFGKHCANCHGDNALGKNGPNLVRAVGERSDWAFFATVKWGRPGTAMAAQPLPDDAIWDVHAFVRRLALGMNAANATSAPFKPVATIPAAEGADAEWLTYAGNHAGHRFSKLAQVGTKNVSQLGLLWITQLPARATAMQATPLMANGVLFVAESDEGVAALDARSGALLWRYRRPLPTGIVLCCGSPIRGVALGGDTVFVTTLDAHLVALDAKTGKQRWIRQVADYKLGYSITSAPLAIGDKVVTGVASGESYGPRGQVAAFAAQDGSPLWTFHTVPAPGEPGHDSWEGNSAQGGGAPTWVTGAYDPATATLFWGTGNATPAFNSGARPGDNLYANCAIALDANTGKLKWHYQFVPNDDHDWDAAQQPVLGTIDWKGRPRDVVLWANRNGFFYALDRTSGEFLYGKPFVKQTWNAGFDARGRPYVRPDSRPSPTGALARPVVGGATSWWPPAYDASRKLVFVPSVDAASLYFSEDQPGEPGKPNLGGGAQLAANQPAWAGVKAIDATDGSVRWQTTLREGDATRRVVGGMLSTAGGVVFAGYDDEFLAFDADRGTVLWSVRLGARVAGSPITYTLGDMQVVVVTAGSGVFAFALPPRPAASTR